MRDLLPPAMILAALFIGCSTTDQEEKEPVRTDAIDWDSVHSTAPARVIAGPTDSVKRRVGE
ncbi:MAG: hypothetical protein IT228_01045 [Flavobacteriales bacterium]|nr:hypothetical protein [Flavobacteriales bacterium]MCC6575907.1 hypothetical protein [Flavobacteriales bacterium]NUQ14134.1 hypothetical protein [Flavobacteriales bacterium]